MFKKQIYIFKKLLIESPEHSFIKTAHKSKKDKLMYRAMIG